MKLAGLQVLQLTLLVFLVYNLLEVNGIGVDFLEHLVDFLEHLCNVSILCV